MTKSKRRTNLTYPDGDFIDVFVVEQGDNALVTDEGTCLDWIYIQRGSPLSESQMKELKQICKGFAVQMENGRLIRQGTSLELDRMINDLANAVYTLTRVFA